MWLYHLRFHLHLCPECPTGHCVPPARSGHRCVADSTHLYVFGGYNPDFEEAGGSENEDYPLFRELWRFHFATATWQQVRTEGYMPTELASMSGMECCVTGANDISCKHPLAHISNQLLPPCCDKN